MTQVEKVCKGDRFVCLHPRMRNHLVGVVIVLTPDPAKNIGLQFDENIDGHSCDGRGKDGYCLWVRLNDILTESEYIESLKIKQAALEAIILSETELDEIVLRK